VRGGFARSRQKRGSKSPKKTDDSLAPGYRLLKKENALRRDRNEEKGDRNVRGACD